MGKDTSGTGVGGGNGWQNGGAGDESCEEGKELSHLVGLSWRRWSMRRRSTRWDVGVVDRVIHGEEQRSREDWGIERLWNRATRL